MGASIVRTMSATSDGSDEVTLLIDAWPSDVVIRWDWIAAMNRDSRGTSTRLILQRGRQVYNFTKTRQTGGDTTVHVAPRVKAPGDFRAGAIFEDASSGDRLEISVFGEIVS